MKYQPLTRRHLLQGASGFALALPFMPSLMSTAHAQSIPKPKFLVMMAHGHGGISVENTYPIAASVSANLTSQTLYAAMNGAPKHDIVSGNLLALKRTHAQTAGARHQPITDFDNGAARVSPLVGSFVPDALLAKLNLLCGLDVMPGSGHWAGMFGNFGNAFGGPADATAKSTRQVPTIDYVIGQSSKFYSPAERALVKAPSLLIGGWDLSVYQSGSDVGPNPYRGNTLDEIYRQLFTGVSSTPGQSDPDAALVDVLYEDYRRLARGAFGPARRLGQADRVRLEAHMANLQDIGNRLKAIRTASCSVPTLTQAQKNAYIRGGDVPWEWDTAPASAADRQADVRATSELVNLMVIQAFLCGTTRMMVRSVSPLLIPDPVYQDDPHHLLYHLHFQPPKQQDLLRNHRDAFAAAYVDLIAKMNATEVLPGVNLLDQSLVYWTAESGVTTHDSITFPTIAAGSAGGFLKTGQFIDYRNALVNTQFGYSTEVTPEEREVTRLTRGLSQGRWLATICQAMGLAPADYEFPDTFFDDPAHPTVPRLKFPERGGKAPGYGDSAYKNYFYSYPEHLVRDMSEVMPLLKA
jgi:Protein of unknown function (DUF1552)